MNNSTNNEKIEKYLDELANEYKELLYKALVIRSNPSFDLSVSELLRLDSEIKKPLHEDYQKQQRLRRILMTIGLTYMFLGLGIFVFFTVFVSDFQYNRGNIVSFWSVILSVVGLFIAIYSRVSQSLSIFPQKHSEEQEGYSAFLEYKIAAKWRELEGIVNDISISENVKTSRSIIEFLLKNQFIDEREYHILKDFLKMRNNIVHSGSNKYSSNELSEMLDNIEKILEKIKKIV